MRQFTRTFKHWNESKKNKFDRPDVKIKADIRKTTKGIHLQIHALVIDGRGAAHPLWHWLAFGTKTTTAKKNIRFPLRRAARTTPNKLDANPFPGWRTDSKGRIKWVTIKKGRKKRGIPPRNWYEAVASELINAFDKLQADNLLEYTIEDTKVRKS